MKKRRQVLNHRGLLCWWQKLIQSLCAKPCYRGSKPDDKSRIAEPLCSSSEPLRANLCGTLVLDSTSHGFSLSVFFLWGTATSKANGYFTFTGGRTIVATGLTCLWYSPINRSSGIMGSTYNNTQNTNTAIRVYLRTHLPWNRHTLARERNSESERFYTH